MLYKILKFGSVGSLTTILGLSINTVLLKYFNTNLYITYSLVYIFNVLLSYYLNSKYTFKSKLSLSKMIKYYVVYLSGLFLGVFLLKIFKSNTGFENWIYPFLVLPFTFTSNFLLSNWILPNDVKK